MPEGHTIHRLAREQQRLFAGHRLSASSPQGRFAAGARLIDGRVLRRTEAYGKHLLHHYDSGPALHVHLGLYGKFTAGAGQPPEPRGALRLRLVADEHWADLRGPTACELIEPDGIVLLRARLGPDPLRADADPSQAFAKIMRSRTPIAALLMNQEVIAGIGNVYRAEILYRQLINPMRPGRDLREPEWTVLWADLVTLMRSGVRSGRIVTTRAPDRPRPRGRPTRDESFYVYRRTGLPCRVCGTEIRLAVLAARNLFWCPTCQAS